jgi:RNA polymerase-binding transcription factor DksA
MAYSDKLQQRKKEIELTLRHLAKELHEVQQNTEWIDQKAYERRISLLDLLAKWYREEIIRIDDVLGCVQDSRYGLCLACHEPIEADRLAIYPEAELCFDCQEFRDRF